MSDKPKIAIIGGGAVGLTYAYFLSGTAQVKIITRTAKQASLIRNDGIAVTQNKQTVTKTNFEASDDLNQCADCDAVIIAVKSYHTKTVADKLATIIKPRTQIVTLQNGLEALGVLQSNLPNPERVFAGVTYIGVKRGNGRNVQLGQFTRTVLDPKASILVGALKASAFGVETPEVITQAVWDKLVLNVAQNALSAITNLSAREMLASEYCVELAKKLLVEFEEVAKAEGIYFTYTPLDKVTANWGGGDDFYPSMWHDVHNGNRTEIDALNGALASLGKKHGINTPYNSSITLLIKAIENNQ